MGEYGFSRQTVCQALFKLKLDKMINRVQGSGSFVSGSVFNRKKTMRIAGITTDSSAYIFPAILRRIKTTATAAGYSILFKATPKRIQLRTGDVENSTTFCWGVASGTGQLQPPILALV